MSKHRKRRSLEGHFRKYLAHIYLVVERRRRMSPSDTLVQQKSWHLDIRFLYWSTCSFWSNPLAPPEVRSSCTFGWPLASEQLLYWNCTDLL